MNNIIHALLARCVEIGVELLPLPNGNLKVKALAPVPEDIHAALKEHKAEVLHLLTHPYLTAEGELRIPFTCPDRYHWWKPGEQSISQTLQELDAPADVWRKYIGNYTETKQ